MSTCAVIASAWTPASVRPAPWTAARSPVIRWIASSSACWTDGPWSCRCQPMNGPPSYSIVSRQRVTGGSCPAGSGSRGEARRRSSRPAGALKRAAVERILAAGDDQRSVEHLAGLAGSIDALGIEQLDPLAIRFEPGAGGGGEGAHLPLDLLGGLAPVDPRLGLVDLRGIGDAVFGLRDRRRSGSQAIRAAPPRPISASSSVTCPAFLPSMLSSRLSSIGPVSSPSSIRMMVTPVTSSPARIARWIGAAPRQRGSSEAWTLMQPALGASRIGLGRISP